MKNYFQSWSRKALIAAAVLASFASVTRYAGISIIAAGVFFFIDGYEDAGTQKNKRYFII
ncbi:MAG: hypothetical protein M3R50_05005 [Bacteroidota bacterium]|nr:hypothetical protein [Bacteroidota bacterium]